MVIFGCGEVKGGERRKEGEDDHAHCSDFRRKGPLESLDQFVLPLGIVDSSRHKLVLVLVRSIKVNRSPSDRVRDPLNTSVDELHRAKVLQIRIRVLPVRSWLCEGRNEMLEDRDKEFIGKREEGFHSAQVRQRWLRGDL